MKAILKGRSGSEHHEIPVGGVLAHYGLRRARSNGKKLGRPKVAIDGEELLRLRSDGLSLRDIAKRLGVSRTTVSDMLRAMEQKV